MGLIVDHPQLDPYSPHFIESMNTLPADIYSLHYCEFHVASAHCRFRVLNFRVGHGMSFCFPLHFFNHLIYPIAIDHRQNHHLALTSSKVFDRLSSIALVLFADAQSHLPPNFFG